MSGKVPKKKVKKSRWKRDKSPESPSLDFYYSTPNSKLLTILVLVAIVIVIICFFVFKSAVRNWESISLDSNSSVSTYVGVIGVPIGIILSFVVSSAASSFSDAQTKENQEASSLFILYTFVAKIDLPEVPSILQKIRKYTKHIINVEFPLMSEGKTSTVGVNILKSIGDKIMGLQPEHPKDVSLYNQSITAYKDVFALRIARYSYVLYGIPPELLWVLILGVILIIVCTFFTYCSSLTLQCICTCLSVICLTSLLFLVVALNFPYRGDLGLDSTPFTIALANMQPEKDY